MSKNEEKSRKAREERSREALGDLLSEGESLKWSGFPQAYSITGGENRQSTLTMWIVAAVLLLFLNIGYAILCSSENSADFEPFALIFTIGIPLFVFVNPIRDRSYIKNQIYALTDRRAIVCNKSNKEMSLPIGIIDSVRVEKSSGEGCCHVALGSPATGAPTSKFRKIALSGKRDKDDSCIGIVFYNINARDGDTIRGIINEMTGKGKPAV
jgi:hypothetical protein